MNVLVHLNVDACYSMCLRTNIRVHSFIHTKVMLTNNCKRANVNVQI